MQMCNNNLFKIKIFETQNIPGWFAFRDLIQVSSTLSTLSSCHLIADNILTAVTYSKQRHLNLRSLQYKMQTEKGPDELKRLKNRFNGWSNVFLCI